MLSSYLTENGCEAVSIDINGLFRAWLHRRGGEIESFACSELAVLTDTLKGQVALGFKDLADTQCRLSLGASLPSETFAKTLGSSFYFRSARANESFAVAEELFARKEGLAAR